MQEAQLRRLNSLDLRRSSSHFDGLAGPGPWDREALSCHGNLCDRADHGREDLYHEDRGSRECHEGLEHREGRAYLAGRGNRADLSCHGGPVAEGHQRLRICAGRQDQGEAAAVLQARVACRRRAQEECRSASLVADGDYRTCDLAGLLDLSCPEDPLEVEDDCQARDSCSSTFLVRVAQTDSSTEVLPSSRLEAVVLEVVVLEMEAASPRAPQREVLQKVQTRGLYRCQEEVLESAHRVGRAQNSFYAASHHSRRQSSHHLLSGSGWAHGSSCDAGSGLETLGESDGADVYLSRSLINALAADCTQDPRPQHQSLHLPQRQRQVGLACPAVKFSCDGGRVQNAPLVNIDCHKILRWSVAARRDACGLHGGFSSSNRDLYYDYFPCHPKDADCLRCVQCGQTSKQPLCPCPSLYGEG